MIRLFRAATVTLLLMGALLLFAAPGIASTHTLAAAIWTMTGSLNVAGDRQTEFLLPTGKAFIVNTNSEPTAELYPSS